MINFQIRWIQNSSQCCIVQYVYIVMDNFTYFFSNYLLSILIKRQSTHPTNTSNGKTSVRRRPVDGVCRRRSKVWVRRACMLSVTIHNTNQNPFNYHDIMALFSNRAYAELERILRNCHVLSLFCGIRLFSPNFRIDWGFCLNVMVIVVFIVNSVYTFFYYSGNIPKQLQTLCLYGIVISVCSIML